MLALRRSVMPLLVFVCLATPAFAGFPSTEVFLPAVGRVTGNGGAQFFTTVWATNLTGVTENFTFQFLKQGQANGTPASFADTLAPGETKVYENIVETKLGLTSAIGAARVTSSGEIFVSERIFDQAPGADLGDTEGLFFAGVPKSFSISSGQSASIQGLNQGGAENFRYNFALVETGGGSPTVNVQVFDGGGVLLGQKTFALQPFEQLQPNVSEVVPGFSSTNARLTATVTGGTGSVLLAGAQLANISQDSSGFEMSFRDDLLGGGTAGVTSLNGLAGALSIKAGNGITVTPSGSSIQVAFTGGGSSGITSVAHDASLVGAGTGASPLAIANGQVVRSLTVGATTLHDAVTLAAGSNVTITPSGNTLTIAASGGGGGGGLTSVSHDSTLRGSGTAGDPLGWNEPLVFGGLTIQGDGTLAIVADGTSADLSVSSDTGPAIFASSVQERGVEGLTNSGNAGVYGGFGSSSGLLGQAFLAGVIGDSNAQKGVVGLTGSGPAGVLGKNKTAGVDTAGVMGIDGTGTSGQSGSLSAGVLGESSSHIGVEGRTGSGVAAVRGLNSSSSTDTSGVFGRDGTGTAGITSGSSSGVRGESKTNVGVLGLSGGDVGVFGLSNLIGVAGSLPSDLAVRGELGSHEESQNWAVYGFGNAKFVGTMTATGMKSFLEPHPTDATKQIRFVCLEGPESGTYFRGSGHAVGGFAKIEVPESFRDVTDEKGLTVVATAVGGPGSIWVVRKNLDEIVLQANTDVDFDYIVNGFRKAYKDFQPIEEDEGFVPLGPNDSRFALYAPELQRRLVATGIYHADGTVNLETAHRLGWDKQRSWKRAEAEKQ
jgi:hypothetical protein